MERKQINNPISSLLNGFFGIPSFYRSARTSVIRVPSNLSVNLSPEAIFQHFQFVIYKLAQFFDSGGFAPYHDASVIRPGLQQDQSSNRKRQVQFVPGKARTRIIVSLSPHQVIAQGSLPLYQHQILKNIIKYNIFIGLN